MSKAVVVLSGGQDSTTCLYFAKQHHSEIYAITFDYNQRHKLEVEAARKIAKMAGVVHHEVLEIGSTLQSDSPLTNPNKSLETYSDYKSMDKIIGSRVELTFVPMRNALFLTIAANRASLFGAKHIFTGVCQQDRSNYPDCRAEFISSMTSTINAALGDEQKHLILAPLINLKKSDSVKLALTLPGCYQALAYSHTAYDGKYPPTGKDHASVLRAHGFEEAGVPDPLVLRAVIEGKMKMPSTPNYQGLDDTPIDTDFFLTLEQKFRAVESLPL